MPEITERGSMITEKMVRIFMTSLIREEVSDSSVRDRPSTTSHRSSRRSQICTVWSDTSPQYTSRSPLRNSQSFRSRLAMIFIWGLMMRRKLIRFRLTTEISLTIS